MSAAVVDVRATVVAPHPGSLKAPVHRGKQRRAFCHGGVDHLAATGFLGFVQGAHDAEGQQHAAAAEVADRVHGRQRRFARLAYRMQHSGQRNVIDVVARRLRQGAVLAPAGHAAIDQSGVASKAGVRSQSQTFHNAGTEAFEQDIGPGHKVEHSLRGTRLLEVDRRGAPPPRQDVEARFDHFHHFAAAVPVDAEHLRPHVGQHHGAKRRRPQTGDFDDLDSRQRSAHALPVLSSFMKPNRYPATRRIWISSVPSVMR